MTTTWRGAARRGRFGGIAAAALLTGALVLAGATVPVRAAARAEVTSCTGPQPSTRDFLGNSVAVSGRVAVAGEYNYPAAEGEGAAYIFLHSAGCWRPQLLIDPDLRDGDRFGSSVSASMTRSGTFVAIGAPGTNSGEGVVYAYTRSGGSWHRQQLADPIGTQNDRFGASVSLSGKTLLVGAECACFSSSTVGHVYVYVRSGGHWQPQATLIDPADVAGDGFGQAVSVAGGTAVVGALDSSSSAGLSYVYARSAGQWHRRATFTDPAHTANDQFGAAVTASGSRLLIGAPGTSGGRGRAYLYHLVRGHWKREATLANPHTHATTGMFGMAVALAGPRALAAAPAQGQCGNVYEFKLARRLWRFREQVKDALCPDSGSFGSALGLTGRTAVIGADSTGNDAGSVLVVTLP
jgi:hypothetical protein